MSLVGFKASNHPQQTSKRGAKDATDDRGTDQAFFDSLSERFGGFTLDVAAAEHNAKCERFFTVEDDGLQQQWSGRIWCNPPYSDCGAWVRKAWHEWARRNVELIVMLLPANRVEQAWWQDHVEPYRDRWPTYALSVEFLRGRMRFDRPDWTPGPKGDRPPFGCCLLIWSFTTSAFGTSSEARGVSRDGAGS
jgi:phage N-6-adenine-methyltransferase